MNWYAYNFLAQERLASRPLRRAPRGQVRGWLRLRLGVLRRADAGVAARGPGSADGTAAASITRLVTDGGSDDLRSSRAA